MTNPERQLEHADCSSTELPTESELLGLFQSSLQMLCIARGDGYFTRVNPAFQRTLGYRAQELLSRAFCEFIHPADQEATARELDKLVRGVPTIHFENRYRCCDGSYRWLSWTAVPQEGGNCIYAVADDVTHRKQAEAELLASEKRYRQLLEAVTSYTYSVVIQDGVVRSTSHGIGCAAATGYTPEDFTADPYLWIDVVHPDDRELVRRHAAQAVAGSQEGPIEHRMLHRDGTVRWVRHKIVSHLDGQGHVARTDGIIEDITERRVSEERFRMIVEFAPDAMVVVDGTGQIILINAQAESLFGYTRDELLGQMVELLVPQHLREQHSADRATYAAQPGSRMMGMHPSLSGLRKDGSEFPAEIALCPIRTEAGTLVYAAIRDVTERRQAEERLQENRSQLLAAQKIQQCLLPACSPVVPGFDIAGALYPAEFAAGDHFDFLEMPDHQLGIVVADVAGHGVGPAILMASTHAFLHALAQRSTDVSEILGHLNRIVVNKTEPDRFVTALLARLDPRSQSLVYSSAGHPNAYVLNRQGGVRAVLPSTSFPLGITLDAQFPASEPVLLRAGDVAVLCTDGLLEAMSRQGDLFGHDRLIQVVSQHCEETARSIVAALYKAVTDFAGSTKLRDDVTVVVMKVQTAGPETATQTPQVADRATNLS